MQSQLFLNGEKCGHEFAFFENDALILAMCLFFFFFFLMFFHASNFDSYVLELRYEESSLILLSREVLMMTTRLQVHSYSCHVSEIKEKKG